MKQLLFILVSLFISSFAQDTITTATITGNDRLRSITVIEYPNATDARIIDVHAVSAQKTSTTGSIDAGEFVYDTVDQTTLFYSYFSLAAQLNPNSPTNSPSAAVAAAFAFAMRAFAIFEYLDLNGVPGYQEGTADRIIGAYDLSAPSLPWNPITVSSTTLNSMNGGTFKVWNVSATTLDQVFTLTFIAVEQPVYVGPFRISPDNIKIDFSIRWFNQLHVPATWTTGPSTNTSLNSSVGILGITIAKFGVAAYNTNGNQAGNASSNVTIGSGAFNGGFSYSPTADVTVQGVVAARSVHTVVADTSSNALVNAAWAAGWVLKIIFLSFDGGRPTLVFWDPIMGADINYALLTSSGSMLSSSIFAFIALLATMMM